MGVEAIFGTFPLPVLEALVEAFPIRIIGFHADNGSEYINHRVARLLDKPRVEEFTKSRLRRSNDNTQVESRNGTVVRHHLGYGHAVIVNEFTPNLLSRCSSTSASPATSR